jgi:RimJ/RimL family protein N-acetyltransferase
MPAHRFSPCLEDDYVTLRQWGAADFDFYAAHLESEATAPYLGGKMNRKQAWRHLASVIGHWSLRGFGPYAVVHRPTQQLQGCAGAWEPDGWPCREFVFWFTAEAYESACALHAARLVLDAMTSWSTEDAIAGFIHPLNVVALNLARQLGGTHCGEKDLFHYGPHVRVCYPHPRPNSSALPPPI